MKHWLAALAVAMAAGGAAPGLAQDSPAPAAPAAPTEQLDPERLAIADQVINLSYPPAGRRAMLMSAVDAMTAQVRAALADMTGGTVDAGMEEIVERHFRRIRAQTERVIDEHSDSLFAAYARAYARRFTRDELVQIRAFVSTPAGQKYVQESIRLLADPDVARANTAYMTSAFSALESMQAELRRELRDYMQSRRGQAQGTPPRGTR